MLRIKTAWLLPVVLVCVLATPATQASDPVGKYLSAEEYVERFRIALSSAPNWPRSKTLSPRATVFKWRTFVGIGFFMDPPEDPNVLAWLTYLVDEQMPYMANLMGVVMTHLPGEKSRLADIDVWRAPVRLFKDWRIKHGRGSPEDLIRLGQVTCGMDFRSGRNGEGHHSRVTWPAGEKRILHGALSKKTDPQ